MIYTLTFNPSLDYIVDCEDIILGKTNRSTAQQLYAGGKGINVSMVLKNLGIPSVALGFTAGFTGQEIETRLKEKNILTDFIRLTSGFSRINVKLRSEEETEINGTGPKIPDEAIAALYQKLDQIQEGDYLVLAGSIPASLPSDSYEKILKHLENRGIRFIVDATGELLMHVLPYHPFLIKPNNHELEEIFGVEIHSQQEIVHYAKELQKLGARNVLISMAGDGAILIPEEGDALFLEAPKGKLVNSVGAGDSMVAGFVAGCVQKLAMKDIFKQAVCTGSASAFSETLAEKDQVESLKSKLKDAVVL